MGDAQRRWSSLNSWKLFKMATSKVEGLGSDVTWSILPGLPATKSPLPLLLILFPLEISTINYIISTTRELPSGRLDPCCFYHAAAAISSNPS